MAGKINRYLVTHKRTCSRCNGDGWYRNPAWDGANEVFDAAANPEDGFQAMAKYWRDKGYSSHRAWPAEEIECYHCEGDGVVVEDMDLQAALYELGILDAIIQD